MVQYGYGIVGFYVPLDTRHIIGHFRDDFMGQMTQPSVSQHWRMMVNQPGQGTGQMTQPSVSQHWRMMVNQPGQGSILTGPTH